VISGSSCREDREALGGAILGVPYEVEDDVIPYRYKIEMPERSEASAEGAPVTVERLEDFESGKEKMTRRKILSCLMAEYDPLGLISPALVKSKLMIRGLYRKEAKLGWDSTVSEVETGEWVKRFRRQLTEGAAVFPRSTKPQGAVGIPDLTGFADSSLEALCVAIYVVWTVGDGSRVARLMMAKCRVAPLSGTSIPRGELQAMVVLLRLMASMVSSLWMKVGKITVFSDSQCTLAALRKVGAPLRPYFANRVSESLALLKELEKLCDTVVRVRHVPGKLNPADLGTRGTATMTDLGSHSTWQDGPAFLRLPEDQWPETLEEEGAIPTEECVQFHVNLAQEMSPTKKLAKNPWMILIGQIRNRTSLGSLLTKMAMQAMMGEKWDSIARIFARVIKAIIQGDQEKISSLKDPSPTEVCLAKEMMFVASAPSAVQAFQQDQLLSLGGILRGGEVWIEGRVRKEKLADLLGMSRLRIIMPGEPLAVLITRAAHCQDHRRNYKDVVARVRRLAWIPKGTRLAKTIVDHCPICRLQDKKEGKQLMGPLPDLRLQSSAPFVNTSLDLFGPFNVKDVAKGRRTFKCWAVAFACLTTKAVCFLACPGYDAVTFITTYRGFVAIYGPPTVVYSDHAPSIIRASEDMDWEKVAKELGRQGTEWRLTLKGCSWRNGVAERVIRSARHTLSHLLQKDKLLNFQELNTILLEVSAVINSRPLAIRVGSEGNFHSISASDILLGRTPQARPVPLRMEDEQDNNAVADNFFHLQELVSAWWEEWMVHCFPEMVYRTKWKVSHRDLCVGDIGHIKYDSKVGRPSWKLARVTEVHPGADQKVRTITVSFRPTRAGEKVLPYNPKGLTKMKIGVQRFAVLYTTEEQNLRAASEVETGDLYKTPLRPHPPSGGV
jgi:transposase InsO family protein